MTLNMTLNTLEIPNDLEKRFDGLAKKKGTPKFDLILTALEEWIEDQEDAALADEIMAGIRNGSVKILSSEEVSKRLGLDN